jgi:hypothetical protein
MPWVAEGAEEQPHLQGDLGQLPHLAQPLLEGERHRYHRPRGDPGVAVSCSLAESPSPQ